MTFNTSEIPSVQRKSASKTLVSAGADTEEESLLPLEDKPRILIESLEAGVRLELGELWVYRELLYFLTLRDIKVRYKQTLMGAAWVIIQPLGTMLILTLFFNKLAGLQSGQIPYPLFAYSGLLLWTFFSNAVVNSTNSLVSNTNLITKVYFPRMFIPIAAVGAGLVDLAIASIVLIGLAVYYQVSFGWKILALPIFISLAVGLAVAVGMLISALTVKYRDLKHALPFIIQAWMFASPVIYPPGIVPEKWRWLLNLNPLSGIIEGFRSALIGRAFDWPAIAAAAAITSALLVCSIYVFRRTEDTFADLI
jgi:lipopolysaccharide transport system permease protein